jgi:hypothetical protein
MPQMARRISTGIALLISKTEEGICPKLDRPPLYLLSALKIQPPIQPKSIWSFDAATDRL